jgi:hypothetical protein
MTTGVGTEVPDVQTLTAEDRCDRCGAQAYVVTAHGSGELKWCAHDFRKHEEGLANFVVVDELARLA